MSMKDSMYIKRLENAFDTEMYVNAMYGEHTEEWTYNLTIDGGNFGVHVELTEDEMRQIAELYERNHSEEGDE